MKKEQSCGKNLNWLFMGLTGFLVATVVVLGMYIANYMKPLPLFENAQEQYNFDVIGKFALVSRKDVKKMMTEPNGGFNPVHREKYQRVLMLSMPFYPMSPKQQFELGVGVLSDSEIIDTFKYYENKTIDFSAPMSFSNY